MEFVFVSDVAHVLSAALEPEVSGSACAGGEADTTQGSLPLSRDSTHDAPSEPAVPAALQPTAAMRAATKPTTLHIVS